MKILTLREFRAKLSHYLKLMKEGEQFDVGGIAIGMCTRVDDGRVHAMNMAIDKEKRVTMPAMHVAENQDDREPCTPLIENTCERCKLSRSECYKLWEDGDEHVVCIACIKAVIPTKMLKGYLRKLQKL